MLTIGLLLSLFLLFYSLIIGEFPDTYSAREKLALYGLSAGSAMALFIITAVLFKTPVAAMFWAVLGWFIPGWVKKTINGKKQARLRSLAKDFVTSAAGLYAVGQTSADVVRVMAERFPEPFASEFQEMIAMRNMSPHASFPRMFAEMGQKYNLSEFKAVSAILAASERAGGPYAAAKGLKRLGQALRQRERLITERAKATLEPKIAAIVTVSILTVGLLLDATAFKHLFEGAGRLIMAASSAIVVGLIFMVVKINRSEDLV